METKEPLRASFSTVVASHEAHPSIRPRLVSSGERHQHVALALAITNSRRLFNQTRLATGHAADRSLPFFFCLFRPLCPHHSGPCRGRLRAWHRHRRDGGLGDQHGPARPGEPRRHRQERAQPQHLPDLRVERHGGGPARVRDLQPLQPARFAGAVMGRERYACLGGCMPLAFFSAGVRVVFVPHGSIIG